MSDDARDGIATAMIVAQHLREEAPDRRDRVENSVAVFDAIIVEDVQDHGFGQNIRKGKPPIARKTGAHRL